MKECDNSKIHISSNFLFSICLLKMLDNLLLGPSQHIITDNKHGPVSVVGITTAYRLDGPGIESRWGRGRP
jgi:hypothetical protein